MATPRAQTQISHTKTVIDDSNASLEELILTYHMQGLVKKSTFSLANNYIFSNLLFLVRGEDDRVNVAFLHNYDRGDWCFQNVVGNVHWNLWLVWGLGRKRGALSKREKIICLPIFSFYERREICGHVPPFSTANGVMSGSSASLEALIANIVPTGGTVKEATFQRQSSSWLPPDRSLFLPMASGKRRHLACRLALTLRCCKHAFGAQCTWRVFLTMGIITFLGGREAHYASSWRTFLHFPLFNLSLLFGIDSGSRDLLDSLVLRLFPRLS